MPPARAKTWSMQCNAPLATRSMSAKLNDNSQKTSLCIHFSRINNHHGHQDVKIYILDFCQKAHTLWKQTAQRKTGKNMAIPPSQSLSIWPQHWRRKSGIWWELAPPPFFIYFLLHFIYNGVTNNISLPCICIDYLCSTRRTHNALSAVKSSIK